MSEEENANKEKQTGALERRGFFYTLLGGALAAIAGWVAGAFPRNEIADKDEAYYSAAEARISALETKAAESTHEVSSNTAEARISNLEGKLAEQASELTRISEVEPIAHLEGGNNELVVFNRRELTVIQQNAEAVFLNLVNANGGVGIRFYKDFSFGNEQVTNPWSIWIEGVKGYQNLAIIRDWRFTAALWDADGRFLSGKLDPYPPGNSPAKARFDVRGSQDEVQAIIEANGDQTADIFQVIGGDGKAHFTVNGEGNVAIGSPDEPKAVILHDTVDGSAYALQVTNGRLVLVKA
jgi:uncharacterized coiled-coil protein SlyX